ncbi:MAG: 5,10-methylenetetrahydrofolate reductase [Verrucomicrobia bacterium ADurb.Bin345]|nr:MAG: 5,10-methylenetetrahydrofolate reductase [Verrucomicrobia bacterium ADurb.Bin345]
MSKRISDLLANRSRPLLSIEFFPPKDHKGFAILGSSIERMRVIRPDFVTVTYGAGGSTRDLSPVVSEVLGKMGFSPIMPHLTCLGSTRQDLEPVADRMYEAGYRNIMAIRGDPPQDQPGFKPPKDGLLYASELVAFLKNRYPDLCCGVAGYPETHPEAESPEADIRHLKEKLDAGGSFVVTQLFYDNAVYFDFVTRCRRAGIEAPIIPGLLPAVSLSQAQRMSSRCKASFPAELAEQLEKAGGSGPVAEAIGIQWTVKQIDGLLAQGVPGVHLYILNRAKTALAPALEECLSRWR